MANIKEKSNCDANHRHGLSAILFGCEVCHKRKDDRTNRARALQQPAGNHTIDRRRKGSDGAADTEHCKPEDNDALASDPVGQHPKGICKIPWLRP